MSEHPSQLDRLEARLEAQTARIDELYRLLEAASGRQVLAPAPRRRPRRRPNGVAAIPRR